MPPEAMKCFLVGWKTWLGGIFPGTFRVPAAREDGQTGSMSARLSVALVGCSPQVCLFVDSAKPCGNGHCCLLRQR